MKKFWNSLGNTANLIGVVPVVIVVLGGVTAYLIKADESVQFMLLISLLILIILSSLYSANKLNELLSPKKPRIIKTFDQPDTYIFYQGVWRKIPDWQTRDYLAHVLGFRPGEEDIEDVSKEFIRTMKTGAPLESVFTYSR